jgi:ubiquinone/menaquinone biosynthesis C-methylase UbiE
MMRPGLDSSAISIQLVCPTCRGRLECDHLAEGGDSLSRQTLRCEKCSQSFPGCAGSFDFAGSSEQEGKERDHYQKTYDLYRKAKGSKRLDLQELSRRWNDPHWPGYKIILRQLGDLRGKTVLCLGNGSSVKELYFLHLGAHLILSDLSFSGVLSAKAQYDLTEFAGRIAFHAINAYAMPLRGNSIDIIYGYAVVHHLADLSSFLEEARRVLRPGGICVFFDNAYSPLWQGAKMTFLWPLMKLSHLVRGVSPEDLRATYEGGYREEVMRQLAARHGFADVRFERFSFFQYLFSRGTGKLLGWNRLLWVHETSRLLGLWLDAVLARHLRMLAPKGIGVVWGFAKA